MANDSMVSIKVDGQAGLRKGLLKSKRDIDKVSKMTVKDTLEFIRDDAKKGAPVGDTEKLRDGINMQLEKDELSGATGMFDSEVDYAEYVEFGTSKQAPQPFMTPAVEAARRELPKRLEANARKVLER